MKKNLIAALLAALLLCSCAAGEQPELQPVPEESSAVEQPIQREEETESAQTKSAPAMPVNEENSFPEEITDYLLTQYDPQTAEGETQEQLVERMWVLANNLYFADETFYSDWVEESDMQGPSQNRFIDFDDLTAHLFTEAGKEELLSTLRSRSSQLSRQIGKELGEITRPDDETDPASKAPVDLAKPSPESDRAEPDASDDQEA